MQVNRTSYRKNIRRGVGAVWAVVMMVGICFIAALVIDYGRVQVVKNQLRGAADAAALAAASEVLGDVSAATQAAIATAKQNHADGTPVLLHGSDVVPGIWDPKTHTFSAPGVNQKPNAVKVTVYRTAERGNPIDLPFAKMVGANTCDVHASAIAMARPQRFAIVGLDFIEMSGRSTNSYRTRNGQFSNYGSIASNGNITLSGSSFVNGDAFPGVGKRVIGANHVSGSTTPLTRPLVYPQVDPGDAATNNNNSAISSYLHNGVLRLTNQRAIEIPEGVYYVKGIELQAGSKITFSGKVTMYVTGSVSLRGHASTFDENPDNFRLILLGTGGTIELNGGSNLFADIYAPGAVVTMAGNADIYGAVVGKSVSSTGNAAFHYDLNLPGGVSLVK